MFFRILLVKRHESPAQPMVGRLRVNDKRMQHHHLIVRGFVFPRRTCISVHLQLVDNGRSHNNAIQFFHKQIVTFQRLFRRFPFRVNPALPADDGASLLFLRMDMAVDSRHSVQIGGCSLSNLNRHFRFSFF